MKDKERSGRPQKYDGEQLQELLDEHPTRNSTQIEFKLWCIKRNSKDSQPDVYDQWGKSINSVDGSSKIWLNVKWKIGNHMWNAAQRHKRKKS